MFRAVQIVEELGGGGWHSNRTNTHCHKCFVLTPEDPKPESVEKKVSVKVWGNINLIYI